MTKVKHCEVTVKSVGSKKKETYLCKIGLIVVNIKI